MSNELRIEIIQDSNGEHVSLDNIPLDAAESLQIFIESLTKLAKTFPDSSDIKLKLENNSIDACLVYKEENKIITNEIDNLLENKSDSNVRIKIFKDIQERINLNGLEYKVILKNQGEEKDLTEKFKGKKFSLRRRKFDKQYAIKFIEGNLFAAGGKSTVNVHLDNVTEGIEYKVACTKPQAKKL